MASASASALRLMPSTSDALAAPLDEGEIVARARRGDVEAFETLYRRHAGRVFALTLRMSGDRATARELTHDAFVRAWEKLAGFRGEAAFGTWLHRLTVNVVLEQARGTKRRIARVALAADEGEPEGELHALAPHDDAESRIDLERAVAHLPPNARRVFVLHDVNGYRHEEIATVMRIAEGTVRAHLHRARKLLMEMLSR